MSEHTAAAQRGIADCPSQVPLAMDALDQHIVLATAPLEISLMRVALHGSLTAAGNPMAHVTVVRELSILSVGTPLRVRTLVVPHSHGVGF